MGNINTAGIDMSRIDKKGPRELQGPLSFESASREAFVPEVLDDILVN